MTVKPGIRFKPYFQPICRPDGTVAGYEALVRKSEQGLSIWESPGSLIQLMEKQRIIKDLDTMMWREALAQVIDFNICPEFLTVNTSVVTLQNNTAVTGIVDLFDKYRAFLPDTKLYLEVTETAQVDNLYSIRSSLSTLKDAGIGIILDDFGSGYNALGMLLRIDSFDMVKFGQSVTEEIIRGGRAVGVMLDIVAMFKRKGIKVVFEGIETEKCLAAVLGLEAEYYQGYYFGRPAPAEEWELLLQTAVPGRRSEGIAYG